MPFFDPLEILQCFKFKVCIVFNACSETTTTPSTSTMPRILHWPKGRGSSRAGPRGGRQTGGPQRDVSRHPMTPKLTRKRPAFRGGLLASSGACANLCCHALQMGVAGQVSCLCALRVRAAPSRLIAPKRPPINRLLIPRRVCLRLLWSGRGAFWIETRNALVSVLAFKLK